jgi:hypothetical protein
MRHTTATAVALLTLCLAACSRTNQVASTNPWAQCNPGTWVVQKTTVSNTVRGKEMASEMETKITVIEVTADKIVLEQELSRDGKVQTQRLDVPLHAPPVPSEGKGARAPVVPGLEKLIGEGEKLVGEGVETLTIAGQQVSAQWQEYVMGPTTRRQWRSATIPGPVCKVHMKIDMEQFKQEYLMEVTGFEKK